MSHRQAAALWAAIAVGFGGLAWGLIRDDGGDTAAELAALRNEISALRAELAADRANAHSGVINGINGDAAFVASEIARYKAALARQRYAVNGALTDEPDAAARDAMQRALGTIDAVQHELLQVRDPDGLAKWFDTTMAIRQRWPSQHAWLLPDLKWR